MEKYRQINAILKSLLNPTFLNISLKGETFAFGNMDGEDRQDEYCEIYEGHGIRKLIIIDNSYDMIIVFRPQGREVNPGMDKREWREIPTHMIAKLFKGKFPATIPKWLFETGTVPVLTNSRNWKKEPIFEFEIEGHEGLIEEDHSESRDTNNNLYLYLGEIWTRFNTKIKERRRIINKPEDKFIKACKQYGEFVPIGNEFRWKKKSK